MFLILQGRSDTVVKVLKLKEIDNIYKKVYFSKVVFGIKKYIILYHKIENMPKNKLINIKGILLEFV